MVLLSTLSFIAVLAAPSLETAQSLVAAGDQPSAIVELERVRSADPKEIEGRKLLVKLYLWNERAPDVIPVLEELVELEPNNETLQRDLAQHYIWNSRAEDSAPLYEAIAARDPDDVEIRRTLLQVYGWIGEANKAIDVLEELHRLEPNNLELTSQLAQQYEWNSRGAEAIPLLQALVAETPEDSALRVRLARQLAAKNRQSEARAQLRSANVEDQGDVSSKYLLAQLCHWDRCWKTSQRLYSEIIQEEPAHRDAKRYRDLLRKEHGPRLEPRFESFRDSNQVLRLTGILEYRHDIDEAYAFTGQILQRLFSEDQTDEEAQQTAGALQLSVRPLRELTLEAELGGESFPGLTSSATFGATARGVLWNRVYPSISVKRNTHINRIASIRDSVRVETYSASVYSEPTDWLAASAAVNHLRFSDDNLGNVVFGGLWFIPYRRPFLLKPGITVGLEDYRDIYTDALPYFTPNELFVFAPGIDVGYELVDRFRAEVGYSLAFQPGTGTSHNPRASLRWHITPFDQLDASYNRSGSEVYNSEIVRVSYQHRF